MLQYDEEAGNEAFADDFQQAMTYFTKLSLKGGEMPLKDAYSWSKSRCIMDVGGGRGEMLSHCMLAAGEHCKGVLMDRPWVLDRCALLCKGHSMRCMGLVISYACKPPSLGPVQCTSRLRWRRWRVLGRDLHSCTALATSQAYL